MELTDFEISFTDRGITPEEVYNDFLSILKSCYRRSQENYRFFFLNYIDKAVMGRLEEYLNTHKIPYNFRAFNRKTREEIPPLYEVYLDGFEVKDLTHYGIFQIFPDTDREIFFYYHGPNKNGLHTIPIVACRDRGTLESLLGEMREFIRTKLTNPDRRIFLYHNGDTFESMPLEEVHWEDVILPEDQYRRIRLSIENFLKGESLYKKHNLPYKRGILFAGPPGNGKTMLCKAIAWELGLPFIMCDQYFRDTIRTTLKMASTLAPAVVCFEDLDSINKSFDLSKSFFLNLLDGFNANERVLILATTNRPEEIDIALSRRPSRFDNVFRIKNPDEACRRRMLGRLFKDTIKEEFIEELVEKTGGFSMAYLKELYLMSMMWAIDRGEDTPQWFDILEALETLKKQMRNASKPIEEKPDFMGFNS